MGGRADGTRRPGRQGAAGVGRGGAALRPRHAVVGPDLVCRRPAVGCLPRARPRAGRGRRHRPQLSTPRTWPSPRSSWARPRSPSPASTRPNGSSSRFQCGPPGRTW